MAVLSNPQNWNAYSYVDNNPLKYTDPSGMFWEELGNWFRWGVWVKNDQVEPALRGIADELRKDLAAAHISYKGVHLTPDYLRTLSNKDVHDLMQYYESALTLGEVGVEIHHDGIAVGGRNDPMEKPRT
jgi:hypothetical protein